MPKTVGIKTKSSTKKIRNRQPARSPRSLKKRELRLPLDEAEVGIVDAAGLCETSLEGGLSG